MLDLVSGSYVPVVLISRSIRQSVFLIASSEPQFWKSLKSHWRLATKIQRSFLGMWLSQPRAQKTHENDVLDAFIVVFVRALDKQTPLSSSNHRPKDQRTHAKNLQPTLHSLGQFLGKSLNFREFKTISKSGNHCRSRHFPFLKPTHSVIPYQDFVQLVCKKRQSTIPFCTRITCSAILAVCLSSCLLFALSLHQVFAIKGATSFSSPKGKSQVAVSANYRGVRWSGNSLRASSEYGVTLK